MSFLSDLFQKKHSESVVLIDVGASSVAGGYGLYDEGETPSLLYTRRVPIEVRGEEPRADAMVRALTVLCDTLVREGSPILLRAAGTGRVRTVLVSIDTPWQETSVRTESFEKREPFVFTQSMVERALKQTRISRARKAVVDESIIGTILNGYETSEPYGRSVRRADIIVLTSLIDSGILGGITAVVRKAYHAEHILHISNSSLRYQAMSYTFPHERDMLILDATGAVTTISLVRGGLFIDITEVPVVANSPEWIGRVESEFTQLAKQYPLPRMIFLIAQDSESPRLQKKLAAAQFGKLWLSDNPPAVVPVLSSHIAAHSVRQTTDSAPDLPLLLMALYYQHCTPR